MEHDDSDEIDDMRFFERVKMDVNNDNDTNLKDIYDRALTAWSNRVPTVTYNRIRTTLQRIRSKNRPKLPTVVGEVQSRINNETYGKINGEPFFRCEVDVQGSKGFIFYSDQQKEMLMSSSNIFVDATFKITPRLFKQTLLIGIKEECFFVCVAVLMTHKTSQLYDAIFSKIKELIPLFRPIIAMVDYEAALRSGIISNFATVSINGCWFHYCQAIIKKIKSLGLGNRYRRNRSLRNAVHQLLCLPLLPPAQILIVYNTVLSEINDQELSEYFTDYWIAQVTPNVFSVFGALDRTNNGIESINHKLKNKIGLHGNIFNFISKYQNYVLVSHSEYVQVGQGENVRRLQKATTLATNQRIMSATRRLDASLITPLAFLKKVRNVASGVASLRILYEDEPNAADVIGFEPEEDTDSHATSSDDFETNVNVYAESNANAQVAAPEITPEIIEILPNGQEVTNNQTLPAVMPPSWLRQSRELQELLANISSNYRESASPCSLMCGRLHGNLAIVPCGHSDYCLDCIRNHITVNDNFFPRHSIRCPDCGVDISSFLCIIIR